MGTCYIYTADISVLNIEEKFNEYYNLVPKYRQNKIEKLNRQEVKNQSLGAGALLHMALAELGIDDSLLEYKEGDKGKPYIPGIDFKYSLSHSGTQVMCALCDVEVGCDVELVKAESSELESRIKVAKRFFAPEEYERIKELFSEKKTASGFTIQVINEKLADLFYRYWTLKESVVKTTGLGIFMDLNSFQVNIPADGTMGYYELVNSLVNNSMTEKLRTYEIEGLDDYRYAVCIESSLAYDIEVKNIMF